MFSVFELVVEIADARLRIEHHVLQHAAEALGRGIDLRLGLGRQPDGLGVAAAFEIEHALRAPAVLVVADQHAVRIGRQRGLAGAGEAEEQRHVAVLADIGRAMHRHHALRRQKVIERREHRLLHLAGVVAAADQDHLAGEIERDDGLAAHAMLLRIGLEARQAEDGEFGNVAGEFGALGAAQQRADEHRVPGELGIDAGLDAVFRIGAAIEILREQFLALGVGEEILQQHVELLGRELAVLLPPHRIFGAGIDDDELVFRAAAGMHAGIGAERAAGGDLRFLGGDGEFVESRLGEIPVNGFEPLEAEFIGAMGAVPHTSFLHETPPRNASARRPSFLSQSFFPSTA